MAVATFGGVMDHEFREKLVDCLGRLVSKKEINQIEDDTQFIEELAWAYRVGAADWILKGKEEPFRKLAETMQLLSMEALATPERAFSYAYFLFLSDALITVYFQPWATEWLENARGQYAADYRLSYIYAYSVMFSLTLLRDLGGTRHHECLPEQMRRGSAWML